MQRQSNIRQKKEKSLLVAIPHDPLLVVEFRGPLFKVIGIQDQTLNEFPELLNIK